MLLPLNGDGPLYRRVCDSVRGRIRSGRWAGGTRLPGTRTLARDLGVSRIVVLTAYAQRARRLGPHAFPPRKSGADTQRIDFSYTTTSPDAKTLQLWRRAVTRAAAKPLLDYPESAGLGRLRKLIAEYLREQRGVVADPDDVVVVNGSQQALDITSRLVGGEGTVVGIEDPHYQGTRQAFLAAGATLVPCAVDDDGLDIDRHAARLAGARAICLTPSHQFPTGVVMSIARRLKLLSWAATQGAWIVEDDYDSEFRYGVGAISALQGLDTQGSVLYMGTFARSLFPGLRLGYVVVPHALREHFHAIKWLADRGTSPTEQRALVDLMESGAYESARRRMGRSLAVKRDLLLAALRANFDAREVTWSAGTAGTHLFVRLRRLPARDAGKLISAASRLGVRVYSGQPYFLRSPREATLILGYATVPVAEIESGVGRLARAYGRFAGRA